MRKALLITLALLLVLPGSALAVGRIDSSAAHNTESSFGTAADAVRVVQYVRYAENNADDVSLTTGQVVVWDDESDDGVTIGLITLVGSADCTAGVVLGIIETSETTGAATAQVGTRNWGYIQTYGFNEDAMVQATVMSGQAICTSSVVTSGYAGPCLQDGVQGITQANAIGFAYDAVASSATDVEVFLRLR